MSLRRSKRNLSSQLSQDDTSSTIDLTETNKNNEEEQACSSSEGETSSLTPDIKRQKLPVVVVKRQGENNYIASKVHPARHLIDDDSSTTSECDFESNAMPSVISEPLQHSITSLLESIPFTVTTSSTSLVNCADNATGFSPTTECIVSPGETSSQLTSHIPVITSVGGNESPNLSSIDVTVSHVIDSVQLQSTPTSVSIQNNSQDNAITTVSHTSNENMLSQSSTLQMPSTSLQTNTSLVPSTSTFIIDNTPRKYKFECDRVRLGELAGTATNPVRCADNRLNFSVRCNMYIGRSTYPDTCEVSIGKVDVQHIVAYFGREKAFFAILPWPGFATSLNTRVGKNAVLPDSPDWKKKYIIVELKSVFETDENASIHLAQFISCVSSWARLVLPTLSDAEKFVSKTGFLNKPSKILTGFLPTLQGEYTFICGKVKFGELYGESLAPVRCADRRIYLSLQCYIERNFGVSPEKYTLSVGQSDVQKVSIHFCGLPAFVAIETSARFAEVGCRRIGKNVLDPNSNDQKKRYIILALEKAFYCSNKAEEEQAQFLSLVTWTDVSVLTQTEARKLMDDVDLTVNQL